MRLTLRGRYKARGLMDELLARFPDWRGEPAPASMIPPLRPGTLVNPKLAVQWRGETVWLDVPDDADRAAVDAVVRAHNPDAETRGERGARERREAIARVKQRDPDLARALGL